MDEWTDDDLRELGRTVAGAVKGSDATDVTVTLKGLGFDDLVAEPFSPPARSVVRAALDAQGRHHRTSAVLHQWAIAAFEQVGSIEHGSTSATALALPRRAGGTAFLIAGAPDGDVLTRSPDITLWSVTDLDLQPLEPLDERLTIWLADVSTGAGKPVDVHNAGEAWRVAEALVRVGLAQEMAGACWSALDLAVDHVSSRRQFGQPLGAFQAVQHQLAEAHAWWAALDALCRGAFDDLATAEFVRIAPAISRLATQSCEIVTKATQQVHGAIGFTEEYPLHHHLKRVFTLQGVLTGTAWSQGLDLASGQDLWSMLDVIRP